MKNTMYRKYGKRLFDLIIVIPGIILSIPLLVILTFLVYVKLGRPLIFKQTRPGLNGKPFTLLKFRSMVVMRDDQRSPLPDEKRLTPFGNLLRSTSLDELPELFNVLIGDMSLVGPRPLLMEYLPRYTKEQFQRHSVKPGITGWAQINGRNAITWEEKFNYDLWYVNNFSFYIDLKIICITVFKIFKREGINPVNQPIMPEFKGKE